MLLVTIHEFVVGVGSGSLCIGFGCLDCTSDSSQDDQSAGDEQQIEYGEYDFDDGHSGVCLSHCCTSKEGQAFGANSLCP